MEATDVQEQRILKFIQKVVVYGKPYGLYRAPNEMSYLITPKTRKKIARGRSKDQLLFSLHNSLRRARQRAEKRRNVPGAPSIAA